MTDLGLGAGAGVLLLAAALAGVGPAGVTDPRPVDALAVGLAVVLAAALAERRRWPFPSLVVVNAATLAWLLVGFPGRLVTVLPLIGVYTVGAHRGWRWGLGAMAVCGVTMVLIATTTEVGVVGEPPPNPELVAGAYLAGIAVHYQRELASAARRRLAREVEARAEQVRRHAAEQRLRIAQEVHDIVGHAMATISVQAGVALHVVDRRPAQVIEALTAIKRISDDGLANLTSVLTALHTDDDTPPTAPAPGLDQLTPLLDATGAAGPAVELTVLGTRRPLPAAVDLAAYRIIQESLTNVLRHAAADTVRVDLDYQPAQLVLRVRDDGAGGGAGAGDGPSHGITGMRQRAAALSGQLTAGPGPDGGFEVHCALPTGGQR